MKIVECVKKGLQWMAEMPELARIRLCSSLILIPGMVILLFYVVTGRVLSIPWIYFVVDIFVVIGVLRYEQMRRERQRMEEEEEYSGRGLENNRRRLEEMRKSAEE